MSAAEGVPEVVEVLLTAELDESANRLRVAYHGIVKRGDPRPSSLLAAVRRGAHVNAVQTWVGVPHEVRVFAVDAPGGAS